MAPAIEALGEALTLVEKNGIDRSTVASLFGQILFACPAYQIYGDMIAQERCRLAGIALPIGPP